MYTMTRATTVSGMKQLIWLQQTIYAREEIFFVYFHWYAEYVDPC